MAASVENLRHDAAFMNGSRWDTVASRRESHWMNDSALGLTERHDLESVVKGSRR